jgi:3-oxoacyl-[acyl-carrier-protein] synthase II
MLLGLHGPSFAISSACATGAHAIGEAAEIIRRCDAEVMVCGGADAPITPLTFAGHDAAGALSRRNDDPRQASRPFDAARDGFVIGEGAAVLVLEERSHALARGARVYAELAGYAATTDAEHETRPDAEGVSLGRAIERALAKAGLDREDVDAVFAHATGTPSGDVAEVRALAGVFGEALARLPVPAIKSTTGHTLGAAGAMQALAAVKALECGVLPPTSTFANPDPLCPVDCVPGTARPAKLRHVLSNSLGFGGHNACLVLSVAEESASMQVGTHEADND